MSISKVRKSRVETRPIVSKRPRSHRRPLDAAMLRSRPLRVKAIQFPRRQFLQVAASAAALRAASRIARAQTYPSRPVRLIVVAAAGGVGDITARLMGQSLSERLGQQFFVENRTGAGGNVGTEAVVRAPPDGYTLLLVGLNNAFSATLYEKLNFDFIRDIAPVAGIIRSPSVMVVNPAVPAQTVPEFIAYAKENLGKVNWASAGVGSAAHLCGELFKMMTGVNLIHVPYRGEAPALAEILGGQVQVIFSSVPATIEYIRSGTLRPLAVTTATRLEALPDVPTVGDFVPGYEVTSWFGIGAPRNTPLAIVDTLNKEINAGLADPQLKARFADLGAVVFPGAPVEFGKFIAEQTEKFAGFKAD